MRTLVVAVLSLLVLAGAALCDDPAGDPTTGQGSSIDDLHWMVGKWSGEAFGGTCEELWSHASGGVMIGTFKLMMDGKASMYEIMKISIVDGQPELRLKHFNADLTAWEEKDEYVIFPFVSKSENEIRFDGLTYKRKGNNMTITVVTGDADGGAHTTVIECKRTEL